SEYRVVGTSVARVDIPGKVTGAPSYVHDLRLPGMLHARVVRPPAVGATVESIDESSVRDVPGHVRVVREGNFIGVVAEREEQAIRAAPHPTEITLEAARIAHVCTPLTYGPRMPASVGEQTQSNLSASVAMIP